MCARDFEGELAKYSIRIPLIEGEKGEMNRKDKCCTGGLMGTIRIVTDDEVFPPWNAIQ